MLVGKREQFQSGPQNFIRDQWNMQYCINWKKKNLILQDLMSLEMLQSLFEK